MAHHPLLAALQAATRHEGRVDPPQRRGHDSRHRAVDQPTAQAIARVGTWVSKSGEVAPFELFVDHVSEDGYRLSDRGSLLRRHESQSPRDHVAAMCCHRRNKLRSRRSQGELHVATVSRGSRRSNSPACTRRSQRRLALEICTSSASATDVTFRPPEADASTRTRSCGRVTPSPA